MERARDSIRPTCSSPSSTGLPFKRKPTSQINDGQVDLTLPADRATRKEIERQRLRKLLNQGKKKRRRLNGEKLAFSPAAPICGHVPRKSRSVGNRRKGKSWRSIGFNLRATIVEKSSSSSVQNEIEIEFEIAEVLYGLKKQVSSSDERLIDDDLEKEENQSISAQGCRVDKASGYYLVDLLKAESISTGPNSGTHNQDKVVLKQEASTAEEGSLLCSNLPSNSGNLTSEIISAPTEETQNKQPEKFVIDLNEPPPMDSSLEGDGLERLTSDPKQKSVTEMHRKMEIKDEMQDLDLGSSDHTRNESMQQFQKQQNTYSRPSYQIHMPLQTSHMMACPLIFPLSQNQNLIANQPGLSASASSPGNVRFSYPIGAPFLSASTGNVCTNPSSNVKKMHSSGGQSAQPVPFLDRQLRPSQMLYPIQIQQQKQLPFTTQTISSSSQRNVSCLASKPSAATSGGGGGCQWRYSEKHDLKSEEMRTSTPSFSFASSTRSSSTDAAGLALNFLDRSNSGSRFLPADHQMQHRNSEMIQRMNQADSILAVGNSPAFLGQSGFVLKSCSTVSPASMGSKVFDTSVAIPNCKMAFAKQNALSARIHLSSNKNPLGASRDKPTLAACQLKGVPSVINQQQPPIAATLSNDFSIFSGNLFDKSPHSLRQ